MMNEAYAAAIETADRSITEAKWNIGGALIGAAVGVYAVSRAIQGYKAGHNGDAHGHALAAGLAGVNAAVLGKDAVMDCITALRHQQIAKNIENS